MKRIVALFALLFCLSFLPISTSIGHCDPTDEGVTTIVLQPGPNEGKDCTAKYKYSDTNYNGRDLQTGVQTWSPSSAWNGGNGYSFIQFDIDDQPEAPILVTIRLRNSIFGRSDQGGFYTTGNVFAHKILEPWNETEVTWNRMPSYDPSIISESGAFNVKNDEWIEIDITEIYNEWKAGTPNYGIMLNTEGSDTAGPCYGNREWNCRPGSFYSSDYDVSDHRPALIIKVDHDFPHLTEKIVWQSQRTGNWDIWMMNPDGTDKVQLTTDPGGDLSPIISPQGRKIAFCSERTGTFEIWLMDINGENKTQITDGGGSWPVWSPDGTKIYFRGPSYWDVSVINSDGTNLRYIGVLGARPSLSPDGTKLVYFPEPGPNPNNYNIFIANVDGTNPVNLSSLAGLTGYENPSGRNSWGSNGKILFMAQEPRWENTTNYHIWWVADDGSASGAILDEANQYNFSAGWSPDETKIVFVSRRISGDYNVWTMAADGTNLQQLTDESARDLEPHWGYVDFSPNLDHGLVAYYPFNGNANDESGHGNDGVVNGATLASDKCGSDNRAYSFDGIDDYIDFGSSADILGDNPSQWSYSVWFKDAGTTDDGRFIISDYHSFSAANDLTFAIALQFNANNDLFTEIRENNNPYFIESSGYRKQDWHHGVVVVDKGTSIFKLYVDGQLDNSIAIADADYFDGGHLFLGAEFWNNQGYHFWNGVIDEVRVYNRALSAEDVHNIYLDMAGCFDQMCEGYPTLEKDVIYLGQHPSDIAVTPDETFVYTAGSTGDTSIEAVRLSDNTVTPIPVGNTPWGVAVSPDGRNVYVSNSYGGTVSIIQTSDNTVIDTVNVGDGPNWLTSTNANVYVANYEAGTVSVIRRWDNHVFDPIPVCVNPQGIAHTPDERFVYVANRGGESVSVIRTLDNTVIATIDVPGEPAHLAVSADGNTVYVSQHMMNQVSKIDTASNTIVGDPIHVGYRPVILATSPNGEYLFVLRHYADEIDVVDTATELIVDVISVGDGPYDIAFSADGCRVYVPNHHNRTISVLEGFNHPPVADAGDDLTIFAREVPDTTVNGNGWDQDADPLNCRWLQDGNVLVDWAPVGVNGECLLDLDVFLPNVGEHVLILDVSDGLATATDTVVLLVEPNTAAGFGRDVKVKWDKSKVDIKGNFVLPDGMHMENITPEGSAVVTLADVELPSQAVTFSVDKKGKWKYSDEDNVFGSISKFEVDWKGQEFKFKGPEKIELKTEFIGAETTVLKVKPGKIKGDFTISVGGTTLEFLYNAETKSFEITPTGATILEQNKKDTLFSLPYPLAPDMTIGVSGTLNLSVRVADHFKEGSSKFKLKMAFNPADFNGTDTLPDVVEFLITLGSRNQVQLGDLIGVDPKLWTKQDAKKWEYKR